MPESPTSLDAFRRAYDDYVDGLQPTEPTLDALPDDDKQAARQWLTSRRVAHGLDPLVSLPSADELLARARVVNRQRRVMDVADQIRSFLSAALDASCNVSLDEAAHAMGVPSDIVIAAHGVRLRVLVADPAADIERAFQTHLPQLLAVFGRSPAISTVLLVCADPVSGEDVGALIDRADVVDAVETPSGRTAPPRLRGGSDVVGFICQRYFADTVMGFEPSPVTTGPQPAVMELADPYAVAQQAIDQTTAQGRRARIDAKKRGFSSLGTTETTGLASLVEIAMTELLTEDDLERQLNNIGHAA